MITILGVDMKTRINKSRQREAIREFLMVRKDHPTAEFIYDNVRKDFPNISLGTVYRNLSLMVELGEAIRFTGNDGFDHFDATTAPHYHFICNNCSAILDLDIPVMESLNETAGYDFGGDIYGHTAYFYGMCPECAGNIKKYYNKEN